MSARSWTLALLLISVVLAGCAKDDAKFVGVDGEGTGGDDGTGSGKNESLPPELQYEDAYVNPDNGLVLGDDAAFLCTSIAESVVDIDPNQTFDGSQHAHNHWKGGDELVIFDDEITEFNVGWFQVQDAIVYPGAAASTFELTWLTGVDGAVGRQLQVDLPRMKTDVAPGVDYLLNFTESGQKHTINYTYVQNDAAHAVKTEWHFKMQGWTAAQEQLASPVYDLATSRVWSQPGVMNAHLKWTIHRGYDCLPVDPPHYDQWQNRSVIVLQDATTSHSITRVDTGHPYGYVAAGDYFGFRNGGIGYPENSTVPAGAKLVRVEMEWDTDRAETKPHLLYVTAAEDAGATSTTWHEPELMPVDEPTRRVYDIEVKEGQEDSPYRKTSLWDFKFYLEDDVLGKNSGDFQGDINWNITVWHEDEVVPAAT